MARAWWPVRPEDSLTAVACATGALRRKALAGGFRAGVSKGVGLNTNDRPFWAWTSGSLEYYSGLRCRRV